MLYKVLLNKRVILPYNQDTIPATGFARMLSRPEVARRTSASWYQEIRRHQGMYWEWCLTSRPSLLNPLWRNRSGSNGLNPRLIYSTYCVMNFATNLVRQWLGMWLLWQHFLMLADWMALLSYSVFCLSKNSLREWFYFSLFI